MRIDISVPERQLNAIEQQLEHIPRQTPHIVRRALNRSLTTMQTAAKKEVRTRYHIKAGDIQSHLTSEKATTSNLQVRLAGKGSAIPLDRFKYSPKTANPKRKKAINVAVKKNGNKALPGAFLTDLSGNKIFKRLGKKRLPIERLYGPSVPQMMENENIPNLVTDEGMKTFDTRVNHEVSRILERGGTR